MAKGCMQFVHLIESFEVISSLATLKRSDAEQRGQLAWKTFSPAAAAPPALLPVPAPPPAPLPVGGSPLGGGGGSTLNLAEHAGHAKAVGTVGTTTRSWLVHEGHWTRHVGGGGMAGGAGGSAEPRGAGNLASSSSSDLPEEGGNQTSSEAIRGHSKVIRGHYRSSEAIRGH